MAIMDVKQHVYKELKNTKFPDLDFLYSSKVLGIAEEILEELLKQEQRDFQEKLTIWDTEICFDTFEEFSYLEYFFGLLEHYQWVNNDEVIRKIIENFEPKYIDFGNEIAYSKRYYDMLTYCYKKTSLDSEQKRILEKSIEAYEVRGIGLVKKKQDQLKKINKKLSQLSQKFGNNVLDSQKQFSYLIEYPEIISEMPKDDIDVAKKKAEKKKKKWYIFDASGSSYMSIMKYCNDDTVRKYFYEVRNKYATEKKYDNKTVILDILQQRKTKSHILGYKNYAELSLVFKMADSPEEIQELFTRISQKARKKAEKEIQEIQEFFKIEHIDVWDLSYYARKLKEQKYALDDKELKKYFEFEKVLQGMFSIVKKLYGLEMKKIDIQTYHKDVQVYEVYRDGVFLSYFLTDYFYRPLKRHGAWANILRERFQNNKKLVINVWNFQKGIDGITLLTFWDVETMFHEFGHATHEIMSQSDHSELSGFHVEWDFVELPSQLLENWCRHPQGLQTFAQHYKTGKSIPQNILDTLEELQTFGVGNMILKQNEYATLDIALHSEKFPQKEQHLTDKISEIHEQCSIFPKIQAYNPATSFTHIFDGGYAAWYYSYMWAEIIEKEVWKIFLDSGDIFSKKVANKLYDTILSQWTKKKASELFRDFTWRDIQIDAFLSEKGLSN